MSNVGHKQESPSSVTRREVLKYGLSGGLALGLSSGLWLNGCTKTAKIKAPSVVLITVDTLRADHLGCYGYPKQTSANIDRFAAEAMLFENCFSHAPVTSSSFASILSGFLPHETRVFGNWPLPAEVETLAEIMRRRGYSTVAVVSNYVIRGAAGWSPGFSIYDDTMKSVELVRHSPERIAEDATNRATELLKKFHKDPLFLWVHYQDPHGPYTPPVRFGKMFYDPEQKPRDLRVNRSLSGRGGIPSYQRLGGNRDFYYYLSQYDGEIRYWDEHFGRLLEALKTTGLYDDALIIFSSDHGEDLGQRNYFFSHGENLYNSLMHVPLIVKLGNQLTGRRTHFVQHLDIVPTVFEFIGVKPDQRLRGCDLLSDKSVSREIFSEMKSPIAREDKLSLIFDGFKLIYTTQSKQYELFNLNTDHNEEHDLIKDPDYEQQVKDLIRRLWHIQNENLLGAGIVSEPRRLTQEEIEKLRSLGYTQ
jgi:arylsulfatase A-like enzyme